MCENYKIKDNINIYTNHQCNKCFELLYTVIDQNKNWLINMFQLRSNFILYVFNYIVIYIIILLL